MLRPLILMLLALPALAACGGNGADSKVTETRMDDIDSVEGTISDEMIPSDENAEMAPVEAVAVPKAPPKSGDSQIEKQAAPEPKTGEPAPAE